MYLFSDRLYIWRTQNWSWYQTKAKCIDKFSALLKFYHFGKLIEHVRRYCKRTNRCIDAHWIVLIYHIKKFILNILNYKFLEKSSIFLETYFYTFCDRDSENAKNLRSGQLTNFMFFLPCDDIFLSWKWFWIEFASVLISRH